MVPSRAGRGAARRPATPRGLGARLRPRRVPIQVPADAPTRQLSEAEQARLGELFAAHPRLKAAWDALAELHGLYLADDHKGALEALDRFADIYSTGQIPEFSDTVDTFLAWHDQILGWHHAGRPPNGRIDRTNNLLQVLRRTAHGFTNYANFEARGILLT